MSVPVARRDNHLNFYNIYLLLFWKKSTQTSRQAVCAVTGEVLWGPQRGRKMNAGEAPAAAGWLVLLASAVG
jgi:hypothetical protein